MFSYLLLVSKCSFFMFIRVGEISLWGVFFDITKIITNFTEGISSPKYKSKIKIYEKIISNIGVGGYGSPAECTGFIALSEHHQGA